MSFERNEFVSLVESHIPFREDLNEGVTSKELAVRFNKSVSHVSQVVKNLVDQRKIFCLKEKIDIDRKISVYFKSNKQQLITETKQKKKQVCGNCQWFSGIKRCILLDLVEENDSYALPSKLKKRVLVDELPRDATKCEYYDPRVNGHWRSKTVTSFIRKGMKGNAGLFRCPIKRCCQIIDEFSFSTQHIKIGSNTFYCPHCGSPMLFRFNEGLNRYEIIYWDSHFDILQDSYKKLTGDVLSSRSKTKRRLGVSIIKAGSFYLNLKKEIIYIGADLTPERIVHSKDLTYFPLRKLDYIAVKDWDDYFFLEKKLHKIDPATGRKLYENISLLSPRVMIESVEPLDKEVGGNEIVIAFGLPYNQVLKSNLITRETLLQKKAHEFSDGEIKSNFNKTFVKVQEYNKKFNDTKIAEYKQWQRIEGGCASLMLESFKKEARNYGFKTPSRVLSRMVRGDPFLPFSFYYARSAYDSLINGVNHVISSIIKKEIYNEMPFAWEGLRGWCHRNYPFGLFLDTIEQAKIIALLEIHEAIRNELIKPGDFLMKRGKRYDEYFCIDPESETYKTIQKIGLQVLNTKVVLSNEGNYSLKRAYLRYIGHQKAMLNKLANLSVELLDFKTRPDGKITAHWKKLYDTRNKEFLSQKELYQLGKFSQRFFSDYYSFEPLTIVGINV